MNSRHDELLRYQKLQKLAQQMHEADVPWKRMLALIVLAWTLLGRKEPGKRSA